jgi:alkylation response protein AidB-like acyl-CoA dehydrogenase
MDLRDRPEDEAFRAEVRAWLDAHVVGDFAALGGRGGSGDETFGFETRLEWEKVLAADRWTCLGWPVEYGGRGASVAHQVIFNEEYVKARAPGRVSILGEGLIGPTIIHYGTAAERSCGARATPSPGPAVTWPTCRPGPCSTGTSGW